MSSRNGRRRRGVLTLGQQHVVVDLNVIDGLPRAAERLPGGFQYVVPDVVLHEMAGRYSDPARAGEWIDGRAEKLGRFFHRNRDQLHLGRYWFELSQSQAIGMTVDLRRVLHSEFEAHSTFDLADPREWPSIIREMAASSEVESYERGRTQLMNACANFARASLERPDLKEASDRPTPESLPSWLRRPELLDFYIRLANEKYADPAWLERLTRDADSIAAARWMILVVWLAVQQSLDPTRGTTSKSVVNSWDDMHYAFLATYTGAIWTNDVGLITMLNQTFPSVRRFDARDGLAADRRES